MIATDGNATICTERRSSRLERMVTRARVVRAYYAIREAADSAAGEAGRIAEDREFHSGRQAGLLTALNLLNDVLASSDAER